MAPRPRLPTPGETTAEPRSRALSSPRTCRHPSKATGTADPEASHAPAWPPLGHGSIRLPGRRCLRLGLARPGLAVSFRSPACPFRPGLTTPEEPITMIQPTRKNPSEPHLPDRTRSRLLRSTASLAVVPRRMMTAGVLGLLTLAVGCGSGGGAAADNVDGGGRGGTGAAFDGGPGSHGTVGSAIGASATGGAAATGGRGTGGAQSGGASTGGKGSGFPGLAGRFGFGGFFGGMASGGRVASTGGVGPVAGSTGGAGATASPGSGGTVGMPGGGPSPSSALLPTAKEACPEIKSGNMMFLGSPVTIWAGTPTASQQGPVVIYWYATGSSPQEAVRGLGQAAITEIMNEGGVVAAPGATNQKGTNTGNGVWYTGDFETTDEVIACAIAQLHIDTRRIHAAGFSAGGLQTTRMSYDRSGYLASVVPYSGGITGF